MRIPDRVVGEQIADAQARGKHHLLHFDSGRVLHTHLRMNGIWRLVGRGNPVSNSGLTLAIDVGDHTAVLYRCQGIRLLEPGQPLPLSVRRLGPDLLATDTDPGPDTAAALAAAEPGREVGDVVMDQSVVAGIGNVYKSESLFLAGVNPWRAVGSLSVEEATRIGEIAASLLARGVREPGTITTYDASGQRPWGRPAGGKWVYNRADEQCRRCGTRIRSRGQGDDNRTTYWCPGCQVGPA